MSSWRLVVAIRPPTIWRGTEQMSYALILTSGFPRGFPLFVWLGSFGNSDRSWCIHMGQRLTSTVFSLPGWREFPIRIGEEIGIPNHSYRAKRVFRQVYRCAHRIIAVSEVVSHWLAKSGEVPRDKIVCVNSPVRLPEQRANLAPDLLDRLRVCFVGRLEAVKNPLVLITVARDLIDMGVPIECWIIGDGSQRHEIELEVSEKGLSSVITLFGFQSDPSEFVRRSSVFVQPSLSEGFSLGLVEAMGCAVPVAATSVGSAPELIEPCVTGWLLDDASAKSLTGVLHSAWIAGAERLFEMGRRARLAVEGRFEPSGYIARLEGLYASVATERGLVIA